MSAKNEFYTTVTAVAAGDTATTETSESDKEALAPAPAEAGSSAVPLLLLLVTNSTVSCPATALALMPSALRAELPWLLTAKARPPHTSVAPAIRSCAASWPPARRASSAACFSVIWRQARMGAGVAALTLSNVESAAVLPSAGATRMCQCQADAISHWCAPEPPVTAKANVPLEAGLRRRSGRQPSMTTTKSMTATPPVMTPMSTPLFTPGVDPSAPSLASCDGAGPGDATPTVGGSIAAMAALAGRPVQADHASRKGCITV